MYYNQLYVITYNDILPYYKPHLALQAMHQNVLSTLQAIRSTIYWMQNTCTIIPSHLTLTNVSVLKVPKLITLERDVEII